MGHPRKKFILKLKGDEYGIGIKTGVRLIMTLRDHLILTRSNNPKQRLNLPSRSITFINPTPTFDTHPHRHPHTPETY